VLALDFLVINFPSELGTEPEQVPSGWCYQTSIERLHLALMKNFQFLTLEGDSSHLYSASPFTRHSFESDHNDMRGSFVIVSILPVTKDQRSEKTCQKSPSLLTRGII
jgi:hypothetical protein